MRRLIWIFILIFGVCFTAVACSAAAEEDAPVPADDDEGGALNPAPESSGSGLEAAPETESDVFPRPTTTPAPASEPTVPADVEGYPVPPAPTALPEGYEIPPTVPPLNPYPEPNGTLIWVIKPVGEQCAEAPTTPDLQTAVADMVAFGIPVETSEMIDLDVCTACGCPTSAHFRLQIDAGYLANAAVLGWKAEE